MKDGFWEFSIILYDNQDDADKAWNGEKVNSKILEYFRIPKGEVPLSMEEISEIEGADYTIIIKAVCTKCKKEHLIFDSRIHGNDAADFKSDKPLQEYKFRPFKINGATDVPAQIQVSIKNYWNLADIESNGNPGLTADDYSEMFNQIKIEAIVNEAKPKVIINEDLG